MKRFITLAATLIGLCMTQAAWGRNDAPGNASGQQKVAATADDAPDAPDATQGEGEVRAFLASIYAPYASAEGSGADYERVLEPQLAAAIAAEEGGPGADPFIDAQDWMPFTPTFENVQVRGGRAVATAAFSNGGAPVRIDYQLIRTPTGWRAFDVQSANGGSLRERFLRAPS